MSIARRGADIERSLDDDRRAVSGQFGCPIATHEVAKRTLTIALAACRGVSGHPLQCLVTGFGEQLGVGGQLSSAIDLRFAPMSFMTFFARTVEPETTPSDLVIVGMVSVLTMNRTGWSSSSRHLSPGYIILDTVIH